MQQSDDPRSIMDEAVANAAQMYMNQLADMLNEMKTIALA